MSYNKSSEMGNYIYSRNYNLPVANKEQREKQENYIKKLAYVDSVINKLKLQYGTDLTKEIISQYLINNPPEKYIASNNSLF